MSRRLPSLLFAVCAAMGLAATAFADTPQVDHEFIDAHLPALTGYSDKADQVTSPEDGLNMVEKLLRYRDQVLQELQNLHPLTSPDGIGTEDAFDAVAVGALHQLARAGVASDTTHATPEEAQRFMDALGSLPAMGKWPLPFMVISVAELTSRTADSLSVAGEVPRRSAARMALVFMTTAGDQYFAARENVGLGLGAENQNENAVIMRLRCPKDGGTYRINSRKSRVKKDGDVVNLVYLQCSVCAEPLLLEFPSDFATRLNRLAEKQKLPTPPRPLRPTTVDP